MNAEDDDAERRQQRAERWLAGGRARWKPYQRGNHPRARMQTGWPRYGNGLTDVWRVTLPPIAKLVRHTAPAALPGWTRTAEGVVLDASGKPASLRRITDAYCAWVAALPVPKLKYATGYDWSADGLGAAVTHRNNPTPVFADVPAHFPHSFAEWWEELADAVAVYGVLPSARTGRREAVPGADRRRAMAELRTYRNLQDVHVSAWVVSQVAADMGAREKLTPGELLARCRAVAETVGNQKADGERTYRPHGLPADAGDPAGWVDPDTGDLHAWLLSKGSVYAAADKLMHVTGNPERRDRMKYTRKNEPKMSSTDASDLYRMAAEILADRAEARRSHDREAAIDAEVAGVVIPDDLSVLLG